MKCFRIDYLLIEILVYSLKHDICFAKTKLPTSIYSKALE